jgi:hypothetical protein
MDERRAYETLHNPNKIASWEIIGVCEGRMWGLDSEQMNPLGNEQIRILEEGLKDIQMHDPKILQLEEMQRKYYQAIDDLVFKDFADPETDERVIRGRAMLDKVNLQIEELKSKDHPFAALNKKAMEAQIELCKGNIIQPSKRALIQGEASAVKMMVESRGL